MTFHDLQQAGLSKEDDKGEEEEEEDEEEEEGGRKGVNPWHWRRNGKVLLGKYSLYSVRTLPQIIIIIINVHHYNYNSKSFSKFCCSR